jgi:hypothetical protein
MTRHRAAALRRWRLLMYDDTCGHPDRGSTSRNIGKHKSIRAHLGAITNVHATQDRSASPYKDILTQSRTRAHSTPTSNRHMLQNFAALADFSVVRNHDT